MTVPRLFLVEHRLPRITDAELALLQATLNDTCLRLTARGEEVRYLGSAYLPGPERLLSLFEAATADAVRTVSESSQAPASGLEAAIVLPPPALAPSCLMMRPVLVNDVPMEGIGPSFDAFLSYARADDTGFTDALAGGLVRAGMRVWFDRDSLPNRGTTFDQEIRRAIEASARLVLVVGPNALSREYVAQEWGFADDLGIPVVPVLHAGSFKDLPERLRGYHSVPAQPPLPVDAVVASLVRLLSEPVSPLGMCHGVPVPPPHVFVRPGLLERVSLALGVDRQRPEEAGRAARGAVLYGISGVGKSTVAADFARSTRTRRSFADGIAWLKCGPSFDTVAGARELLERVAVGAKPPRGEDDLAQALAEGLAGREVLVVLDDVRDPDAAAPFLGALGPGGRALLTTLDQAIATGLGAADIAVDELDDASSRRFLEGWAGGPLPPEADAVIGACDGLPFALAIVGAMVKNRVSWDFVVEALEARSLDLLAARFPGYRHPNVLGALAASYDALALDDPDAAACYLELAAFRPGAVLTERVMVRLWSRPGRLARLKARAVLPVLERRLLVQRRNAPDSDRFVLHNLHEDFIRLQSPDTAALEAELVSTYRVEKGAGDWSVLPDDGYVYDHLIAHLASLGDNAELIGAVNAAWVHRQLLRRGDLGQGLDDVQAALHVAAAPPLDLVSIARLSLLSGQVADTLREASAYLAGALAEAGDVDQALRWAADHPDRSQRFDALLAVLEALLHRGELARARSVIRTAAATIPRLGGVVETGWFTGLTAMNAVHALVDFPYPDQWEGTNDQLIAMARIPLDALVRLAPLAGQAGAIGELTGVSHPFWELYGHLIPLVAVERLADDGKPGVAAALLDQRPAEQGTGDEANAARYRRAVASAALGRFEEARAAVDALPTSYHAVGYRGLARHLARAGRADEAIEIIGLIDDETVADKATDDLVEATIELAQPESCRRVAALTFERDWLIAAAWLMAAGGEPGMGLDLLNRAPRDDLRLGLGVRLGRILHKAERTDEAAGIVRQLVPAAERLLGPQWFAPETTNAESRLASLGRALRALVAQTGEPLPEAVTPLGLIYETRVGALPPFKLELIVELVTADRFAEARKLAESSILPSGPGMAMATALMTAGPSVAEEALREAASSLIDAVDAIEPGPLAPPALGAVMRTLTSRGLHGEATRLMEKLVPRPGLWSAVGIWAVDRARAGEMDQVRRLIRQLLVERPMPVADARSRAVVLAAVADRRGSPSDELEAAAALLSDVRVAAGALDVVFAVTDLLARHRGHEAAITFAHSVAGGSAAELAERALRSEEIKWEGEPSPQNIAAAAVTRAVAAAGMVMANSRNGSGPAESRKWLQRAQALADQAERMAPNLGVAAAVGKYIAAAQAELEDMQIADDAGQVLKTAWLVWERGRPQQAASYALQAASKLSDPFAQTQSAETPQIMSAEDLLRKRDVFNAVGAGLHALVAMVAADRGDRPLVDTAVNAILEASPGLGTLSPSEQVELRACLAIGLQRGGAEEAAADQLQKAAGPAYMLARRGEVASFGRLCQALVELLPSDRAALTWAAWLTAAASAGTSEALRLIAAYLRWIPEHDLANVVVNTQTGQLHSRS